MGRFKGLCSLILLVSIPLFIIAVSQNLAFRVPDGYLYYFNDSQCVDQLHASVSNDDVAEAIASFMNRQSAYEEGFQVYEDTGYDRLPIFDSRDSYNMLVLKRTVDIQGIIGIVMLLLTIAIYVNFIRSDERKVLRDAFRLSAVVSVVLVAAQAAVFSSDSLRAAYFRILGMRTLQADSKLLVILNDDLWTIMAVFMTGVAVLVLLAVLYVHYRLTRRPRIFS